MKQDEQRIFYWVLFYINFVTVWDTMI